MVTHGYYVFRYENVYYTFYHHADSYPRHLGALLVENIRNLTDADLDTIKDSLEDNFIDPPEDDDGSTKIQFLDSIMDTLENPEYYKYYTTVEDISDYYKARDFVDYCYIIDLDRDLFIVKTFSHSLNEDISQIFDLYNIPANWIELFEHYVGNIEVVINHS
jgi:hypothetical protein